MSSSRAEYEMAHRALESGDIALALRTFHQLILREPTNADYLNDLGALVLQLGEIDSALSLLARAVEARPNDPVILENFQEAAARDAEERCMRVAIAESASNPYTDAASLLEGLRHLAPRAWRPPMSEAIIIKNMKK